MSTYVALLRGINVGGNNKIKMIELKVLFESLGYTNVVTYINSGNVIFETRKKDVSRLASEIQKGIKKKFKLNIPVVLRTQKNIEKVCKKIPPDWVNDKDNKTDVMFLWDKFASKKTLKLISTNPKIDSLLYVDGAIIWHLKKKNYGKSKMNDIIGTEVYKNMTVRNINTVRKLATLMNRA
ncbi:DUF1697 domain-containing protein [Candidatus Kaiserbacteria bacterium]|nr:DUF1697 domain-containing protein [Candidatus Kaiserbacteria bacterium]